MGIFQPEISYRGNDRQTIRIRSVLQIKLECRSGYFTRKLMVSVMHRQSLGPGLRLSVRQGPVE